jgi:hypothetical protein
MKMNNHILWTYEKQNNPTIAHLARRMGTSEYHARKAKKEATKKGLIASGQLTKLGDLVVNNLSNRIVQDYLSGKVTRQTVAIFAYNCRQWGESTHNIPRLAAKLSVDVGTLIVYLRKAESQELLGIAQFADLNNITYRSDLTTGDVLEIVLNIE